MQNQVPLWATFAIAIMTLIGSVGVAALNAYVTSRRDERRWRREREHADREYWREKRIEIYSSILNDNELFLRKVRRISDEMRSEGDRGSKLEATRELVELGERQDDPRIFLVGPQSLANSAVELRRQEIAAAQSLLDYFSRHMNQGTHDDALRSTANAKIADLELAQAEFAIKARRILELAEPAGKK